MRTPKSGNPDCVARCWGLNIHGVTQLYQIWKDLFDTSTMSP